MSKSTVYDFEARQINGKDIALSEFKGRVMLIVNTASQCGFTPQFGGLEELHKTYTGKGLVVLGFFPTTRSCQNLVVKRRKNVRFIGE